MGGRARERREKKASAQLGAPDKKASRCLKEDFQSCVVQSGVANPRFRLALLALDASGVETILDAVTSTSELLEHFKQPCELARLAEVVAAGSCRRTVQCRADSATASNLSVRVFCAKLLHKARKGGNVSSSPALRVAGRRTGTCPQACPSVNQCTTAARMSAGISAGMRETCDKNRRAFRCDGLLSAMAQPVPARWEHTVQRRRPARRKAR
jgi:hypothetical protein